MFLFQNTQKKLNKNYKYYKSIDYLPLFNFFMVHKKNDLRYILKLEEYETLPDNIDLKELEKPWEDILIQYQEEEDSNASTIKFIQAKTIFNLESEYLVLWNIYNLLTTIPENKEIRQIKKEAGLEGKDAEWIKKKLKALNNQILIKRKDIEKDEPKNKTFDFYRIIDEIESFKGYQINMHKTTVSQYIAIKKNIKAKQANGRQNNAKGRNR